MTESYELQVLFTEEERNTYADWGIKKEKVLMPFAIATVLIYVVTAAFVSSSCWKFCPSRAAWVPSSSGAARGQRP